MIELILPYLLLYKYLALFLLCLLASFGLPFPLSPLVIAAGAFSAAGTFNYTLVFIFTFLGCFVGDNLGYLISRYYGKEILMRIGLKRLINSKKFKEVENDFSNYSSSIIFLSRFLLTGIGSIVNILSGLSKIPFKKYLFYEVLGELVYVIIYINLGYVVGNEWENVSGIVNKAGIILIVFIFVIFIKRNIYQAKSMVI